MPYIEFDCRPTIIGSMPFTVAPAAVDFVTRYLKEIPAWPQLPKRSFLENMYFQCSAGFPGLVLHRDKEKMTIDRSGIDRPLEKLYSDYLKNDFRPYSMAPEYAAGFYELLNRPELPFLAVKGQISGPVSWGLMVLTDENKPVLYDEVLADAAAKFLRLKAAWQEKELSRLNKNTIMFIDEPYMASFGSAFMQISKAKVVELLEEVLGGITGLKGVHCCGNTDWSVLLKTSLDILSFDAYNYASSVALYPAEMKAFLGRGGTLAFGIIPNTVDEIRAESAASLQDRLEEAMAPFTRQGIRFRDLVKQSLLTPCCGLAGLDEDMAARVMELLIDVSTRMRAKYS